MDAGSLDRRVRFDRAMATQSVSGQATVTWVPLATVWAARRDVSDGERFRDDQHLSDRVTRFTLRYSPVTRGITAKDRLVSEGIQYEVLGVKENGDGRRAFIEVTARARNEAVSG